jgi:hypothetical protein
MLLPTSEENFVTEYMRTIEEAGSKIDEAFFP